MRPDSHLACLEEAAERTDADRPEAIAGKVRRGLFQDARRGHHRTAADRMARAHVRNVSS